MELLEELLRRGRFASVQDDACFDVVLRGFRGRRDHGGVGNLWERLDRRLQFEAGYVLAFSSQDIPLAVDERELPARQSAGRVTGVVPEAREGLDRRRRVVPVPIEHRVTAFGAKADFADFSVGHGWEGLAERLDCQSRGGE